MKRAVVVLYLIAMHALLGAVAYRRYFPPPSDAPIIAAMREVHRQEDPQVPAGATIFLGDSITLALATAAVAPLPVNYGIGWQRSDQLIESMRSYESLKRAATVVVTIGVNDLLQGKEAGIDARYRAILAAVPNHIPVVMSSVTPLPTLDPQRVRTVRDSAAAACAQRAGCKFVDALAALGKPNVLQPDQIHLDRAGYALWIGALRHALDPQH